MPATTSPVLHGISPAALVVISILVIAQLALEVFALVDLIRRTAIPREHKWLWALLIIVGGLVGAILYLAFGRKPGVATSAPPPTGAAVDVQNALDVLYRPKDPP